MKPARRKLILPIAVLAIALLPLFAATPVLAGKSVTYACTVAVQVVPGIFYVRTTITATGGYLPSPEADALQAFQNGILYSTPLVTNDIPGKSTTYTFTIPVSSNGPGAYTFNSYVGKVNGHGSFTQLAFCYGYATV